MSELENARIQKEALDKVAADKTVNSASRNRLWAGLNRYLATEAEKEHKAARREQEAAKAGEAEEKPPEQRKGR